MFKTRLAVSAGVGAILLSGTFALADDSPVFQMRSVVAVLGHDTIAFAPTTTTDARLLSAVPPRLLQVEQGFVDSESVGEAQIRIHLDSTGAVTSAVIDHTSGFSRIDAVALSSVRSGKYQAATVEGQPVGGDYLVSVEFPRDAR